tara:strand:+ start:86 stop:673 length:588 start_codon:yes stop_codon:yes gene_type:complete
MISTAHPNLSSNSDVLLNLRDRPSSNNKIRRLRQNGQIQIYQSAYRGSYSTIIRDSLRSAALGRKVLLVQLMKGGVNQGIANPIRLCGNLLWLRPSNSFDQHESETLSDTDSNFNSIKESIKELWEYSKKQLLAGEQDQVILDEIFRSIELGIVNEDDLISTLKRRYVSGDVILTGTSIPKSLLSMADQVTELRS